MQEQQSDGSWADVDETAAATYTDDITDLDEGTKYTFRVIADYGDSQSSPSDPADATTTLAAPSGASGVAVQPDEANITWTDHSSDEDGFYLTYGIAGSAPSKIEVPTNGANAVPVNGSTAGADTGYALTGLTPGKTYQVKITAYKGSVLSDPVTTSFTTPSAPVYTWSEGQGPFYDGHNTTTLTISNLPTNQEAAITIDPTFVGRR